LIGFDAIRSATIVALYDVPFDGDGVAKPLELSADLFVAALIGVQKVREDRGEFTAERESIAQVGMIEAVFSLGDDDAPGPRRSRRG
jgi:hypothetical protein